MAANMNPALIMRHADHSVGCAGGGASQSGGHLAMEGEMTRDELASKLDHLDPGATLIVTETVLATLFGDGRLSKEAVAMIEAFALEHRCTFSVEHGRGTPTFEKDDIF